MRIQCVTISEEAEDKIIAEHGVTFANVESVLLGDPYVCQAKGQRYMAIGLDDTPRFVTVIFEYWRGEAEVVTAYPSSDWQIRLYRRKRRGRR